MGPRRSFREARALRLDAKGRASPRDAREPARLGSASGALEPGRTTPSPDAAQNPSLARGSRPCSGRSPHRHVHQGREWSSFRTFPECRNVKNVDTLSLRIDPGAVSNRTGAGTPLRSRSRSCGKRSGLACSVSPWPMRYSVCPADTGAGTVYVTGWPPQAANSTANSPSTAARSRMALSWSFTNFSIFVSPSVCSASRSLRELLQQLLRLGLLLGREPTFERLLDEVGRLSSVAAFCQGRSQVELHLTIVRQPLRGFSQ